MCFEGKRKGKKKKISIIDRPKSFIVLPFRFCEKLMFFDRERNSEFVLLCQLGLPCLQASSELFLVKFPRIVESLSKVSDDLRGFKSVYIRFQDQPKAFREVFGLYQEVS